MAELDQGRRELLRRRGQLLHQRVGVEGELAQAGEGQARFVEERRKGPEGVDQLLVTIRGGTQDVVGVLDQLGELSLALAQGIESHRPVGEEPAHRDLLRVEGAEDLLEALECVGEVGERITEALPPSRDRDG